MAKDLLILADRLIDGKGHEPQRDVRIVVREQRIVEVAPDGAAAAPSSARVLDLRGRAWTVIPGLVDAHSHLWHFFRSGEVVVRTQDPPAYIVARMVRQAAERLGQGVTSTREMGTPQNLDVGLRDAIIAGVVPGPRLYASGMGLAVTGGMYGKQGPFRRQTLEITGADEARRAVRQQIDAGVDFIKLYATAGVGERGHTQMTLGEISAATEEAHKAGRTVAAHAISLDGVKTCLRGGVDTIEHGKALDEEAVAMMVDRQVVLCPTLAVGKTIADRAVELGRGPEVAENARRLLDDHRHGVAMAHRAGVKIAAGTDPAYGDSMARECELLVECGLSAAEAIVAATRRGAETLGLQSDFGTVEAGRRADLVVLGADPLADIRRLDSVEYVIRDGVILSRPDPRGGLAEGLIAATVG